MIISIWTALIFYRFLIEEKDYLEDYCISKGHPAPCLPLMKEFICWYIDSTKGRIADKPTMSSALLCAQQFVPGFEAVTGTEIADKYHKNLYSVSS